MISIPTAVATFVTTLLAILGAATIVSIGLGVAGQHRGRLWLASPLIRIVGVVGGIALIVAGFWIGPLIRGVSGS